MKSTYTVFLHLLISLFSYQVIGQEIIVCGNDQVLIIDYSKTTDCNPEIIWMWQASVDYSLPEEYRTDFFAKIDECKPINDGKQIMITSSMGGCAVLDRASKKAIFYGFVNNAHSMEYLPGNRVVVAASTKPGGDKLALFDLKENAKLIFTDSLHSAHGVVYFSEDSALYALGFQELRHYELIDWYSNSPKLNMVKSWKIPGIGGHDLIRVPGTQTLLFTDQTSVYTFDIENSKFKQFDSMNNLDHVKSVSVNSQNEEIIYVKADDHWWSHKVRFANEHKVINLPGINLYKARWSTIKNSP